VHALLALNWEPQLRGILIIIIAVSVLCGSVYLILGTNLGARLGFLVALAGLSGWIMLMGLMWWAFGIGLKGDDASWKPVHGQAILLDANAVYETGVISAPVDIPDGATYQQQAELINQALLNNGWTQLNESDTSFGQSAAAGGVIIEEDGALKAGQYQAVNVFSKGGERYPKIGESFDFFAFRHRPHYILVEIVPLVSQRAEPGRAPARPEIDTTQPHRYVYMIRDLGNKRVPAALVAFGSGLVFFSCCYFLHTRDRRVIANRSAGLAIPARE